MDTKIAKSMICLYSKFSPNSTKFLDLSKSYNLPLEYVCIDNKNIRNRIVKNKKILIYSVPCLLFIYDNGVLEKYEGYNAFEWINDVIKNIEKASIDSINNNNINNTDNTNINNVEKLEVEKIKNKVVSVASKKVSKNPNPPSTPIDLLDDESDQENIDKNMEEITEEDEEDEEEIVNNIQKPNRDIDTSGFNSSKVSSGIENKNSKKDVMSLARELEKQRETEENSGKKNRKNI